MQLVVREYSGKGAKELFDILEKHQGEIERLLRQVKGFIGYTLARSGDGGVSVTVCQDQAGIDESTQAAKDWIAKNAAHTGVSGPRVSKGTVITHLR
jgi:restriction endonuclease Mrr